MSTPAEIRRDLVRATLDGRAGRELDEGQVTPWVGLERQLSANGLCEVELVQSAVLTVVLMSSW